MGEIIKSLETNRHIKDNERIRNFIEKLKQMEGIY